MDIFAGFFQRGGRPIVCFPPLQMVGAHRASHLIPKPLIWRHVMFGAMRRGRVSKLHKLPGIVWVVWCCLLETARRGANVITLSRTAYVWAPRSEMAIRLRRLDIHNRVR